MREDTNSGENYFAKLTARRFTEGEMILNAGDRLDYLYYVEKGVVRSFYIDEEGNELTINLLKTKGVFPLSSVIAGKDNIYDYQAFTDVEVKITRSSDFLKYLENNCKLKGIILNRFAIGLEGYLVRSFYLIKGSAMQKVASTFIMLASRFGKKTKDGILIDLPLTHQNIADLAGITRETASIQIETLEKEGLIIRSGRKTKIVNSKSLSEKAMVGEDGSLLNLSF
jgi:CRP/FNR family transcriptional regulator